MIDNKISSNHMQKSLKKVISIQIQLILPKIKRVAREGVNRWNLIKNFLILQLIMKTFKKRCLQLIK
jgi:hypothetical protein